VLNYTFLSPEWQSAILGDSDAINIRNPISHDLSQMRQSLLPGLLLNLKDNLNRQQTRLRIAEMGAVFHTTADGQVREPAHLAGLHYGARLAEQWGAPSEAVDFYDLKADVEALLAASGQLVDASWVPSTGAFLHPTRSAEIKRGELTLGYIGELHPKLLKKIELNKSPVVFELAVEGLTEARIPHGESPSKFPSVRRDIALVVDESVTFANVQALIHAQRVKECQDCVLFDVYRGQGIEKGRKSLAIGLILQDKSRTLSESEVDSAIEQIKAALSLELGATFRE